MVANADMSQRFTWDGKNFKQKYDANGNEYQPRSPGIPQCWEVGVGEPCVGENVKLVGGRYRTLKELEEPRVRGWDPETLRKPQSCQVLHCDDKVLGGRLTKVFPETFQDSDCGQEATEDKVEVEVEPRPRIPFSMDCPIVRPSQEVIDRVRTVGHGDFEEKVRLLGMTGKWDTPKVFGLTRSEEDREQESAVVQGDSMKRADSLPAEASPVFWQTDYMQNFSVGAAQGCGTGTITKLRSLEGMGTDGGQGSLRLFDGDSKVHCGEGECEGTVEIGKLGESVGRVGEGTPEDRLVGKSTRLPVPTFHSRSYSAVAGSG